MGVVPFTWVCPAPTTEPGTCFIHVFEVYLVLDVYFLHRFYAGGSERSGQQIVGPPRKKSPNELVDDLFKGAKEHGAVAVERMTKSPGETSKPRVSIEDHCLWPQDSGSRAGEGGFLTPVVTEFVLFFVCSLILIHKRAAQFLPPFNMKSIFRTEFSNLRLMVRIRSCGPSNLIYSMFCFILS